MKTDCKRTLQQLTELYDSTPGYAVRHNSPMQVTCQASVRSVTFITKAIFCHYGAANIFCCYTILIVEVVSDCCPVDG